MTHIPAQGEPGVWPEHGPDPAHVRAWISVSLPGHPEVTGPTMVHRAHAWGLTARFRINSPAPGDVVFKASFLPPEFSAAAPYRLLRRVGAISIPELLAWADEPERRWLLFRPFRGDLAGDRPGIEPLIAVATAMARIQTRVAATPEARHQTAPDPVVPVSEVPAMLDRLIGLIRRRGEPGSAETADRLDAGRERVRSWTEELDAGGWPTSIHHVDLHPHNAAILATGEALIYDWEEASLGFPFFALDKLLLAAAERSPDGSSTVRAAYLDAIHWRSRAERERAFDLAMRLSPIRFADADARFARALGWSQANAVAPWIPIALERWEQGATP